MSKFGFVFFILVFITASVSTLLSNNDYQEATIYLINFVEKAVSLIEEQGAACFDLFRHDKNWLIGDLYIFVWDLEGYRYVYPPDLDGEGKNMSELEDADGKPIGKMFIEKANLGSGWVQYQWPRPNQDTPETKSTYIMKAVSPDNKEFLVGSGIYLP